VTEVHRRAQDMSSMSQTHAPIQGIGSNATQTCGDFFQRRDIHTPGGCATGFYPDASYVDVVSGLRGGRCLPCRCLDDSSSQQLGLDNFDASCRSDNQCLLGGCNYGRRCGDVPGRCVCSEHACTCADPLTPSDLVGQGSTGAECVE